MRRHLPLIATIFCFLLSISIAYELCIGRTGGRLIYTLDDTYMHAAIAKNMALHNVYGLTKYEFSASSSSPLWTFLLAFIFRLFGVNEIALALLNLFFACGSILIGYAVLRRSQVIGLQAFFCLTVFTFAVPLPALVYIGMEHTMHLFFSVLFMFMFSRRISENNDSWKCNLVLFLSAFACVASRYEGIFLVAPGAAYLMLGKNKNKLVKVATLVAFALAPIIIMGVFQMAHGWYFIPNTYFLKGLGQAADAKNLLYFGILKLSANPYLFNLVVIGAALLGYKLFSKNVFTVNEKEAWLFIFLFAALLHGCFAAFCWFYRYEAYLVGIGILGVAMNCPSLSLREFLNVVKKTGIIRGGGIIACGVVILYWVGAPLFIRSASSYEQIPKASKNIYEMQYQMGLFLKKYFNGKTIAANDPGAICFLADIRLVDLVGLGSKEPIEYKINSILKNRFRPYPYLSSFFGLKYREYGDRAVFIETLVRRRGVDFAIVYDSWFPNLLPKSWLKTTEWEIPNNVVCGGAIVSFYAVNQDEKGIFKNALGDFEKILPNDVRIKNY